MLMDGPLQLARAIFRTGAPFDQPLARFERHFNGEAACAQPRIHVVLKIGDFVIRYGRERFRVERLVGDHMIDAIDEFRRKLAAHGAQRNALELAAQFFASAGGRGRLKSEIGLYFPHHFFRAQIAGQKYQAFFEIDRRYYRPA